MGANEKHLVQPCGKYGKTYQLNADQYLKYKLFYIGYYIVLVAMLGRSFFPEFYRGVLGLPNKLPITLIFMLMPLGIGGGIIIASEGDVVGTCISKPCEKISAYGANSIYQMFVRFMFAVSLLFFLLVLFVIGMDFFVGKSPPGAVLFVGIISVLGLIRFSSRD